MNLLLLGSGGREHAIAWKLTKSPRCEKLFVAPGNAGTAQCGTNVNINPNDFDAIKKFCLAEDIGMVIVGPEEPLVNGIVDSFREDSTVNHIPVFGPSKEGAQLEGFVAHAPTDFVADAVRKSVSATNACRNRYRPDPPRFI